MSLSPYISFAGNCADAIAYYQQTLGAELLYKINFGEMPQSAQDSEEGCPSGMKFPDTAIAHANLRVAGSDIMMSDGVATEKPITPASRWSSTRRMSTKGSAGLTTRQQQVKSKWTGRKHSGRTVSVKSPTSTVCRG